MPFPTVAEVLTYNSAVTLTSHIVPLPAVVNAGELLLIDFSNRGGNQNHSAPWGTELFNMTQASGGNRHSTRVLVADGTEGGQTVTYTVAAARQAVALVWRIQNWEGTIADGIDFATNSRGLTDTILTPPPLSPSWGADDVMWLAGGGTGNDDATVLDWPAAYPDNRYDLQSGGGNGAGVALHKMTRELNAASESPGSITLDVEELNQETTIAIRYGTSGGPPGDGPTITSVGDDDIVESLEADVPVRGANLQDATSWEIDDVHGAQTSGPLKT